MRYPDACQAGDCKLAADRRVEFERADLRASLGLEFLDPGLSESSVALKCEYLWLRTLIAELLQHLI